MRRGGRLVSRTAALTSFALAAGIGVSANAATAPVHRAGPPAVSPGVAATGLTTVQARTVKEPDTSHDEFKPTRTAWPSARSGTLALAAPKAGASSSVTASA